MVILKDLVIEWWISKRPVNFTEKDHLQHATVNCNTKQEKELAKAITFYIK